MPRQTSQVSVAYAWTPSLIGISPHGGGVLVFPVLLPEQRGTDLCPPGTQPLSLSTPLPLTLG